MEDEKNIERLMIEKLSGTISLEDSNYLDSLLRSEAEIRQQWEDVKESFEVGEPQRFLASLDTGNAWLKFRKGIEEKKYKRTILIRKVAVAASLMIPLFLVSLFYFHSKTPNAIVQVNSADRSVKLYLNGSDSINLSNYKSASIPASLKNAKLNIGNGNLSYVILKDQGTESLNTLAIPETLTYKVTLSDGSEVRLNSLSQLKFPFKFSKEKREVWVNGEAYFKVTKNQHCPFIVHTALTDIQVLGTEFNVNTYDSLQVKTDLVRGSVTTRAANGKTILLKPGFQSVFSKGKQFEITAFDSDSELSWMEGVYFFRNSSLKNIALVVYRWYGETLIFDNSELSSSYFTGALIKDKPIKDFLDNLALTSNISYRSDRGTIHLDRR
jgi:transmembrane sensor